MADKENYVRLTRAAKKRASEEQMLHQDAHLPEEKRTRVVLGEISSLSNLPQNPDSKVEPSKPKCRSRKKEKKAEVSDLDANDDDPQQCKSLVSDILAYLRSMESQMKRRPLPRYVEDVQTDITSNMRMVLVDWLVEVAEEYKLISDTLYLTVDYIDRYLSKCNIKRNKLQLLGVSCMLVASKYEEITPPHIEDFCYITDNTYTREEVKEMEFNVLNFLKFEMGNPTIKIFLRRFVHCAQEGTKVQNEQFEILCNYLAELSLLDYSCVQFLPSEVAASAVFLSRFTISPNVHPWSVTLQQQTGYTPAQLKQCVHVMHELQIGKRASSVKAIREKYKQQKEQFKAIAAKTPPPEIPACYFEAVKV